MLDELPQRRISDEFVHELERGVLQPILERLQHDDTLSLEIRNGYVNIYYRGGNLLRLTANRAADKFNAFFDLRYRGGEDDYGCWPPEQRPPVTIATADDGRPWVDGFSHCPVPPTTRVAGSMSRMMRAPARRKV